MSAEPKTLSNGKPSPCYDRIIIPDGQDSLSQIARMVEHGSCVLDVGAGGGALGLYLCEQKQCVVDGIEIDPERVSAAKPWYRKIVVGDLDSTNLTDHFFNNEYQFIICADVLEHLRDPGKILSQLSSLLAKNGRILLSVPNIGHVGVIVNLIKGEFPYRSSGLLDSTHLRFFTRSSLSRLLKEHGLCAVRIGRVAADLRETEFHEDFLDTVPENLYRAILAHPDALTYQFIVEAMPGNYSTVFDETPESILRFGCQVFWRPEGAPYSSEHSVIASGVIGEERQLITHKLPPMQQPPASIRLDLADRPGFLHLYSLQLQNKDGEVLWTWDADLRSLSRLPHQQVVFLDSAHSKNRLLLTGCDPHVELPIPPESLSNLGRGGVLKVGMGWPLSSDFVTALQWFREQEYLQNKPLHDELDRLREENQHLHDRMGRLQAEDQRLHGELNQAFKAITQLEMVRKAILASFSWRLTAPLRMLGWFLRLLIRIFVRGFRLLSFSKEAAFQEIMPAQNLAGYLDTPRVSDVVVQNSVTISGWLFSKDIPIKSLSLKVDDLPEVTLTYGYPRPDVAQTYPEFPIATRSGFGGVCSLHQIKRGWVVIAVWATLNDGSCVKCFTRRIKTGTLPASGSPLFIFNFLYGAAGRGWRAFREGRLTFSPSVWSASLRRHYELMLAGRRVAFAEFAPTQYVESVDPYQGWVETNRLSPKLFGRMRLDAQRLASDGPVISIVVPVYNPPRQYLEEMIGSITSQIYPNWELCIADDASSEASTREVLEKASKQDSRIKIIYREENGHIAEATNSALDLVSGEYAAFLDHDDLLSADALLHVAECIADDPRVDWVYTDEDKIDQNGHHYDPQFKGEWSPEMAITHNYTHHLTVIRKSLIDQAGRMRREYNGAQDLDLFLRVAEKTTSDRIRHIPHICYHWRSHGDSTASHGTQKVYIFDAAFRAISDAINRRGLKAKPFLPAIAEKQGLCLYQLKWDSCLMAERRVTIVIPTRDRIDLLKRCISSLQKTVDERFVKLIVVDDQSVEPQTRDYLKKLVDDGVLQCRVIHAERPDGKFNYARLVNLAARHVDTPYMLHLNNDIEAIETGWLEDMTGWLSIEDVGVVGARLLYPDQRVQHGGVVVGPHGGLADHQFHRLPRNEVGYLALPHAARNVSAVTGACLLTPTKLYRELDGFDENNFSVEYNDVDYCLRALAKGKRIVYTPQATLMHRTSESRGRDYNPTEHINFIQRYKGFRDSFFNENLQTDSMQMAVNPVHFSHAGRIKKLKVLLITHNLNLAGAPIVAFEFAKYFSLVGKYEITVISREDGQLRERYEALNIAIHILSDFPSLSQASEGELRSYLKIHGDKLGVRFFDLLVGNTITAFWGTEMARIFGIPSIWHIHESTRIDAYGAFIEETTRNVLRNCFITANRVVFQAEATRRLFSEMAVRGNFLTIPGGLPLSRIKEYSETHAKRDLRVKYGIDEQCTVVTLVGTTCERKGQHVFLEAIKELEKKYHEGMPDSIAFLLVGAIDGPYLDLLHDRIRALGLRNVLVFKETKDVYDFYALSDIFVCASFEESFPMVVLLAMSFGLEIVSTDVFGIPEMISHGHEGRLVKPGNSEAMANAMYDCIENREVSARMAKNAFAKVNRLFDNDKLLNEQLRLTKKVAVEECISFWPTYPIR